MTFLISWVSAPRARPGVNLVAKVNLGRPTQLKSTRWLGAGSSVQIRQLPRGNDPGLKKIANTTERIPRRPHQTYEWPLRLARQLSHVRRNQIRPPA
jgi:hypothetical protein